MKKIYAFIAAVTLTTTTFAQESLPYAADWKYKAEAIAADGTVSAADPEAGKPTSDQSLYDLGGWVSVATAGKRPFYITVSKGKPVVNTMEYSNTAKADEECTSYLISPAFNFPANTNKTIAFKCGKQNATATAQLELVYSTDYTGDAATATWTSLKKDLIPAEQTGLGNSKFVEVSVITDFAAPSVYLAIRAANVEGREATQEKIRLSSFTITASEKELVESLPYEAKWAYKAELINEADSTFVPGFNTDNAGSYKEDAANLNLNGWFSYSQEGDRKFTVLANKNDAGNKRQVPNTMEWTDNKQSKTNTTWFVSPKIDFSATGEKTISFQIGREAADQKISNVDLLYSTDYTDDVTQATWTTIKANVVPADQVGLNPVDGTVQENLLALINEKVSLENPDVTIAFKAHKVEGGTIGSKQTKIRLRNFSIKAEGSSTISNNTASSKAAAFVNGKELSIVNAEEVVKVEVFNVAGQSALTLVQPSNTVNLSGLANGVYLVRLTLNDGSVVTSKVVVK